MTNPFLPEEQKPGGLIKAADWNAAMDEVVRLGAAKVDREGDTIKGSLTIQEALTVDKQVNIGTTEFKATDKNLEIIGSLKLSTPNQADTVLSVAPGTIHFDAPSSDGKNIIPGGRLTISGSNVGFGTTNPQGFHIDLPEKNRDSTPSSGISMSGGTEGNASIELRNNGSGSPYIDFAQDTEYTREGESEKTKLDFHARFILETPQILKVRLKDNDTNRDVLTFRSNGNVGIGNTSPVSRLAINEKIGNDDNFNFEDAALTIFEKINHNGGNNPQGTRDILHLVREGKSGEAYGNKASFALGRYTNDGTKSRTQLDIKLTDDSFSTHNSIISLRSNGNVGISNSNPLRKLDVSGDTRLGEGKDYKDETVLSVAPGTVQFDAPGSSGGRLCIAGKSDNNTDVKAGNVGIGTTTPSAKLYVQGNTVIDGRLTVKSVPYGDKHNMQWDSSTGLIYHDSSSRRFKENIIDLEDDFLNLLNINPKTYTRPGDKNNWEIGYIAEEFHELGLSKLVAYDQDGKPEAINYRKISLYLVEIIKHLDTKLDEQIRKMDDLEALVKLRS